MKINQLLYGLIIVFLSSCSGYTKKEGRVYLRSSNEARMGVRYTEVNADYESFEVIKHNTNLDLAKDRNHVFKGASILNDADPYTFEQIKEYYWRDNKNVYLLQFGGNDCIIKNADRKSFKVINDLLWSKDKNHVFYEFDILQDVNSDEFVAIDEEWGKDKSFYYYHNLRLDSLDYSSAEIISPYYIKDKYHVFFRNILVKDANPLTFVAEGVGSFGQDDKNMFSWEKNEGPITEQYRNTYIDKK